VHLAAQDLRQVLPLFASADQEGAFQAPVVLVGASVWISLYRRRRSEIGERMWRLVARGDAAICGQIWVEFIGGFRCSPERQRMVAGLRWFPFLGHRARESPRH
jgi:hypothetical protein